MDFQAPLKSLVGESHSGASQYSDISDDDVFDIPCSQVQNSTKYR